MPEDIRPFAARDWPPPDEPWVTPGLRTARLLLRFAEPEDAGQLARVLAENRNWLGPWEPHRPPEWWSAVHQRRVIADEEVQRGDDRLYRFLALLPDGEIIGWAGLSGVARGPFQNAHLGYWVAERWTRRGLGGEMVDAVVRWGFGPARLHRIEAAVQPDNLPSRRLLEALGFRHEGRATRYLHIAGAWRDHEIYARTSEEAEAGPTPGG